MRSQINVPFSSDLLQIALDQIKDYSLLIFPTHNAASIARRRFMQNWSLQDVRFIAMGELRQKLLQTTAPVVSDDRRMLCLYQALGENDREHFHLNSYFDFIDWGTQFFQFFEELTDECIDPVLLEDPFGNFGMELLAWQEEYLQRVLQIRNRYKDQLQSLGFTDSIFLSQTGEIRVDFHEMRCILVNQYYFSKLEKRLLTAIEEAGNELLIISQTIDVKTDPEQLHILDIELSALTGNEYRTRSLKVTECENPDQMIVQFLVDIQVQENARAVSSVLIDNQFHCKAYRSLFPQSLFAVNPQRNFLSTGIFSMFQTIHTHLEALNSSIEGRFLSLRSIAAACSRDSFIRYYQPHWSQPERKKLLDEIRCLFKQDILYVDSSLDLFAVISSDQQYDLLPLILNQHFALLDKASKISSPTDLVTMIDAQGGLVIRDLCSEEELQYSNLLEEFYQRLANFASLDRLALVSSWSGFFNCQDTALAICIIRLLMEEFGKTAIRYNYQNDLQDKRYSVNSLQDLRSLRFDKSVFLHVIEGVYPSNPAPVWLFNEAQKARIGLKSYDDLRRRERYYFLRQILTSQEVIIYTYKKQEQDIEPSSFISEIIHHRSSGSLSELEVNCFTAQPPVSMLYRHLCRENDSGREMAMQRICGLDLKAQDDFFVIPAFPDKDLSSNGSLKVSYQSLSQLEKNPFVWFIRNQTGLDPVNMRPEETISRKLFGALLHNYISQLLRVLPAQNDGTAQIASILDDPAVLSEHLSDIISQTIYLYKLPQNYNHDFLTSIISSCLAESVRRFYRDFLEPRLKQQRFELLPEHSRMTDLERSHKELLTFPIAAGEGKLWVRGIADLRISTQSTNMIIDFKTRGLEVNQLYFYEWFYYLLDPEYDGKEIVSTFWMILDQKLGKQTEPKKREPWREKMRDLLTGCFTEGYALGRTVQNRQMMKDITRADLYRPASGGEE